MLFSQLNPKNAVIFAILGVMLAAGLVAIPAVGKHKQIKLKQYEAEFSSVTI